GRLASMAPSARSRNVGSRLDSCAIGLSAGLRCRAQPSAFLHCQSTGYSHHRYLLNRRVAYAKELMANGRLSLTEVALTCGFGSSRQFATTFRRIDSVTPSAYRRGL